MLRETPKSRVSHRARTDSRRIDRLVTRHGLRRGPRSLDSDSPGRWAGLFAELGPLGVAFARHLALRTDVPWLEASERQALARLTLQDEPVPHVETPPAGLLELASEPELVDWHGAWFRGRARGDRPVRLLVQRTELEAQVDQTRGALERLVELSRSGELDGEIEDIHVQDFFDLHVRPRLVPDRFGRLGELLGTHESGPGTSGRLDRTMAATLLAVSPGLLLVPKVVPELCSASVLALEDSERAHGLLAGGPLRSRGPAAARLLAGCFVDLLAEAGVLVTELHIARLDDGRAFLLDGSWIELSSPGIGTGVGAGRILEFLRATAGERPRDVLEVWRLEIEAGGFEANQLRSQLRQATPRRDGDTPSGARESTAEYAMAYWRAASRAGLRLGAPWRAAAVSVESLRRRLGEWDPDGDALAVALVEQSWHESGRRLRALATPRHLGLLADRYVNAFSRLPSLIDRALDGSHAPRSSNERPARPEPSRWHVAAPVLLGLLSIAIVANHFGDQPVVQQGSTVLFIVLTMALLRGLLR